jgi:hypothetical protein
VKITVKYLEKLAKWAQSKTINPIKILTKKDADRMNENEKVWHKIYGLEVHNWKKGDEYYAMMIDPVVTKIPKSDKYYFIPCCGVKQAGISGVYSNLIEKSLHA